jgi:serpin B
MIMRSNLTIARKGIALMLLVTMLVAACGSTPATPPGQETPTEEPGPTATTPIDTPAAQPTTVSSGVKVVASEVERVTNPNVADSDLEAWASGHNDFAFRLYQAIREEGDNLFYSPYSISTALAMTYAGARGETATQMAEVLGFGLPQETLHPAMNVAAHSLAAQETLTLTIANSLWAQEGYEFLDAFLDTLARNYGAGLNLVDYMDPVAREEARRAINAWVENETQGRIEDLIAEDMLTELTRLVLANAIYFKAEWERPFLNGTRDDTFTLLDGSEVTVPMMSRRTGTLYLQDGTYEAVALPYTGGRMQMVVVLPAAGAFEEVESSLDAAFARNVVAQLTSSDVMLHMPRFSYDARLDLGETLEAMGMPDAFDPERADFSGMDGTSRLLISRVAHKAFVAVDEEGTEAAAATGVVVGVESMPVEVRIDRPFIFFIHDTELDLILFVGRVLNPAAAE